MSEAFDTAQRSNIVNTQSKMGYPDLGSTGEVSVKINPKQQSQNHEAILSQMNDTASANVELNFLKEVPEKENLLEEDNKEQRGS